MKFAFLLLISLFLYLASAASQRLDNIEQIKVPEIDDSTGTVDVGRWYQAFVPSLGVSPPFSADQTLETCCLNHVMEETCELEAVFTRWARQQFQTLQHKWVVSHWYAGCQKVWLKSGSIISRVFDLRNSTSSSVSSKVNRFLVQRFSSVDIKEEEVHKISAEIEKQSEVLTSRYQLSESDQSKHQMERDFMDFKPVHIDSVPQFVPVKRLRSPKHWESICIDRDPLLTVCQLDQLEFSSLNNGYSMPGSIGYVFNAKEGNHVSGYPMSFAHREFKGPGFVLNSNSSKVEGVYCCKKQIWLSKEKMRVGDSEKYCRKQGTNMCSIQSVEEERKRGLSTSGFGWVLTPKHQYSSFVAEAKSFLDVAAEDKSMRYRGTYTRQIKDEEIEYPVMCCRNNVIAYNKKAAFVESHKFCETKGQSLCSVAELDQYDEMGYDTSEMSWTSAIGHEDYSVGVAYESGYTHSAMDSDRKLSVKCCRDQMKLDRLPFLPSKPDDSLLNIQVNKNVAIQFIVPDPKYEFAYSYNVSDGLHGGILKIDNNLGRLYYEVNQKGSEILPFTLDIEAESIQTGEIFFSKLTINPRPRLGPEFATAPTEDRSSIPEWWADTFWSVDELSGPNGTVNYRLQNETNVVVMVTGSRIVFDPKHASSPIYRVMQVNETSKECQPRPDIYKFIVRADQVHFAVPVIVPGAIVEIYAREISFAVGAHINNTPLAFTGKSSQFHGLEGLQTPPVKVVTALSPNESDVVFYADGGPGAAGTPSDPGPAPVYDSEGWNETKIEYMAGNAGPFAYVPENFNFGDHHINKFYEIAAQWETSDPFWFFPNGVANGGQNPIGQPPHVGNPILGGKPGKGGVGANAVVNHPDISYLFSVRPGKPGPPTVPVKNLDAYLKATDERSNCYSSFIAVVQHAIKDGQVGEYAKIYRSCIDSLLWENKDIAKVTPELHNVEGTQGTIKYEESGVYEWVSLDAVRYYLSYAKQMFIQDKFDKVKTQLKEYFDIIDEIILNKVNGFDLIQAHGLRSEMSALFYRSERKQNYFGDNKNDVLLLSKTSDYATKYQISDGLGVLFHETYFDFFRRIQSRPDAYKVSASLMSTNNHEIKILSEEIRRFGIFSLLSLNISCEKFMPEWKKFENDLLDIESLYPNLTTTISSIRQLALAIPVKRPHFGTELQSISNYLTRIRLFEGSLRTFDQFVENVSNMDMISNEEYENIFIKDRDYAGYEWVLTKIDQLIDISVRLDKSVTSVAKSFTKISVAEEELQQSLSLLLATDKILAGLEEQLVTLREVQYEVLQHWKRSAELIAVNLGKIISMLNGIQEYDDEGNQFDIQSPKAVQFMREVSLWNQEKFWDIPYALQNARAYFYDDNRVDDIRKLYPDVSRYRQLYQTQFRLAKIKSPSHKDFDNQTNLLYGQFYKYELLELQSGFGMDRSEHTYDIKFDEESLKTLSQKKILRFDSDQFVHVFTNQQNFHVTNISMTYSGRLPKKNLKFALYHDRQNIIERGYGQYGYQRDFIPHGHCDELSIESIGLVWTWVFDPRQNRWYNLHSRDRDGVVFQKTGVQPKIQFLPSLLGDWVLEMCSEDPNFIAGPISLDIKVDTTPRPYNERRFKILTVDENGAEFQAPIMITDLLMDKQIGGLGTFKRSVISSYPMKLSFLAGKRFGNAEFLGWKNFRLSEPFISHDPAFNVTLNDIGYAYIFLAVYRRI